MSIFEFILMLYVIVAGLGMSLLVRSVGQMIEYRARVELDWVHTVWLLLIFVAHVITWFSLWRFREHSPWTLLEALLLLNMPIMLYLVSHLAVPELGDGRDHDMRAYFERHAMWMHGLMLGVVVSGSLAQLGIEGRPDLSVVGSMRLLAGVAMLVGAVVRRRAVHGTIAVGMLVLIVLVASLVMEPIAG